MFRKKGTKMVRRIYVEKKEGFNIEAKGILNDIRENLHISSVDDVRVINRYDVEGISDDTYEKARCAVFAEPAVDIVCDEELPDGPVSVFFATEFLPGQYDQRADSAAQCIKLIDPSAEATVKFARVIALVGDVKESEITAIKNYIVNPVDSREASLEKPDTLAMDMPAPAPVAEVAGFCDMTDDEADLYRKEMGFAMSREDILFVREHFKNDEKRNPTVTELKVIDTYWSDHCRHTTFNTKITDVTFEDGPYGDIVKEAFDEYLEMRRDVYGGRESEKDICLMDLASIGAKYMKKHGLLDDLDESEEINACSIKVTADVDGNAEDWIVMFKNETHNHPTEIEPFGGAATCLGGAIRDPLSGRSYVYQA
ncbi:MAG: phosphoribosylformylglycinamidine synthase, partial [Firmicutes bacterium]|nr:phosphoribosylformylglycinamidine synthase [Bacillota bacterium]